MNRFYICLPNYTHEDTAIGTLEQRDRRCTVHLHGKASQQYGGLAAALDALRREYCGVYLSTEVPN